MEITESNLSVFYLSKIFALAPFSLRKTTKNSYEIRRSYLFVIYSFCLCAVMVFFTYRGLVYDANSKVPMRASFRMKSGTSKVVTALDVSVVVLATTAGVCCGLFGLKSTQELNSRLRKVDETMQAGSNLKKDRIRSWIFIIFPMGTVTFLLGLDVSIRIQVSENSDTQGSIKWYLPFYSLYLILTALHVTFANTAFGLWRRYRRINVILNSTFLADKKKEIPKSKITTVKTLMQTPLPLNASFLKASNSETVLNESLNKNRSMLLRALAENHASLGKCVSLVSSSYGMSVLFILVSCLLHLVATAYFLFLEMLDKKDNGYLYLQVLWIIFHALRLLLVVEPCHLAMRESQKTIQTVCAIERRVYDPILNEEIKKFWQQLLVLDADFTACGLCRVNRNILTSFSSAIATYLVILIQFQKTNG